MTDRSPTRPIQSLDRGLVLLQTVAEARQPISLGELAQSVKHAAEEVGAKLGCTGDNS